MNRAAAFFLTLILLISFSIPGWSAPVDEEMAYQVAVMATGDHLTNYGKWGEIDSPIISNISPVYFKDKKIAYNVNIFPSGHLLIAASDLLSPVLLYSTSSGFDPDRVEIEGSIESWIIPEIYSAFERYEGQNQVRFSSALDGYSGSKVGMAWAGFKKSSLAPAVRTAPRMLSAGPVLTTTWDQSPYYNDLCPEVSGQKTLVGCVATAWSQILNYWEWPDVGEGSHSYSWNGQTLSATFNTYYDWDNMPDELTGSSSAAEVNAVAKLCSDVGIAANMDYGTAAQSGSGSDEYAQNVLPVYFKYKDTAAYHERDQYTGSQWMALIKAEFEASPPRPIAFSIFDDQGGHEVVIDGYQEGATDKAHINFGWAGSYDGYYDVTQNFQASYNWDGDEQQIVVGLEPDRDEPTPPTTYTYYIPLVTQNSANWTGIALCATGALSASKPTVTYLSPDGSTAGTETASIAANGQTAFVPTVSSFSGWAKISSSVALQGLSLVGGNDGYAMVDADMKSSSDLSTSLLAPHVHIETGQWDTYVSLFNPNKVTASVTATFYDQSGNANLRTLKMTIPGNGCLNESLLDNFGSLGPGYVKFSSNISIGGFLLYQSEEKGKYWASGLSLRPQ